MNDKGSLSVEATICLSIVIILFLGMIMCINLFYANEVVNQGLYSTVMEISHSHLLTEYSQKGDIVQEAVINQYAKGKLKQNIKYFYIKKLKNKDFISSYSLKENSGKVGIKYDYELFNNKEISIKKEIPYNGFLHDEISISLEELDKKIVYVTKTGKRYHKGDCFHLRQSKIKTTLSKAVKDGYTPCKHCRPKY